MTSVAPKMASNATNSLNSSRRFISASNSLLSSLLQYPVVALSHIEVIMEFAYENLGWPSFLICSNAPPVAFRSYEPR